MFSVCFPQIVKFPIFSLLGICHTYFPFSLESVGTLFGHGGSLEPMASTVCSHIKAHGFLPEGVLIVQIYVSPCAYMYIYIYMGSFDYLCISTYLGDCEHAVLCIVSIAWLQNYLFHTGVRVLLKVHG